MSRVSDRQPLKTLAGRLEAVPAFGCPSGGTERSVLNSFFKALGIRIFRKHTLPGCHGELFPDCSQPHGNDAPNRLGILFPAAGTAVPDCWEQQSLMLSALTMPRLQYLQICAGRPRIWRKNKKSRLHSHETGTGCQFPNARTPSEAADMRGQVCYPLP